MEEYSFEELSTDITSSDRNTKAENFSLCYSDKPICKKINAEMKLSESSTDLKCNSEPQKEIEDVLLPEEIQALAKTPVSVSLTKKIPKKKQNSILSQFSREIKSKKIYKCKSAEMKKVFELNLKSEEFPFQCKLCPERFSRFEAIGGHMSKAHKGMSSVYQKKLQRRAEREPERKILEKTKEFVLQKIPDFCISDNRSKFARVKEVVKKGGSDEMINEAIDKYLKF